jgi:hypothetical protein
MRSLRQRLVADRTERGAVSDTYSSETFYMGDPGFPDAHVGLYYGHVVAYTHIKEDGTVVIRWRAEVPWTWPSYNSLHAQYGNYHAQCFPLPNARSWLQGHEYCLRVDDGLGGGLVELLGKAISGLFGVERRDQDAHQCDAIKVGKLELPHYPPRH